MRTIYLDHNATTPILPQVADAMGRCHAEGHANPASQHAPGRRARHVIENARERIAELLAAKTDGSDSDRLIFTSGGTEANNLAMFSLAGKTPAPLIVSAIEHPSVLAPAEVLLSRGWQVSHLPVDSHGLVQIHDLLAAAPHSLPKFVALMLGNNETGVLQPVEQLARHCRAHGIPLHCDAVQAVGKISVDFRQLNVATLAFTAHKFHGPRGIGGLLVRSDVELHPLMFGGFQQAGLRPGTEDVALVVGMLAALEHWHNDRHERAVKLTGLRDRFETQLRTRLNNIVINGLGAKDAGSMRLPHTSNIAFVRLDRRALSMAFDLEGIACSTGSACASGSSEPSPVLIAMGLPEAVVAGSLRFSFGATTTEADVDEAVERIVRVCLRLRTSENDRQSHNPLVRAI